MVRIAYRMIAGRCRALAAVILACAASGAQPADQPPVLPPGAASCGGCHAAGSDGPPALGDLSAGEITAALAAFRSGRREGTMMPRIATGFSAGESEAIAAALGRPERDR